MLVFAATSVSAAEPLDVSMIQLLGTPEKFDSKFIRVYGFLRLEFEGKALYLHKEDYSQGLTKNSVWVDVPENGEYLSLNALRACGRCVQREGPWASGSVRRQPRKDKSSAGVTINSAVALRYPNHAAFTRRGCCGC